MLTVKSLSSFLFVLLTFCITVQGIAQTNIDQLKPEEYLDFWVGSWDLTWKSEDGTMQTGTNHIQKILNGKVVLENFEAKSGRLKGYQGKSMSLYDKRSKTWKQTWVDNQSEYIDLVGKTEGNKRIFWTKTTGPEGEDQIKRMVFYDISENSFSWDWQVSSDDGENWKSLWRINYKRHTSSQ